MRVLCIVLILFISGCAMPQKMGERETLAASSSITYGQDRSTGLCFAFLSSVSYSGYQIASFTNVPCDKIPKVEAH